MAQARIRNENARFAALAYLNSGEWVLDRGQSLFASYKQSQLKKNDGDKKN